MASLEEQTSLKIVSQFEAALRQNLNFRYLTKIVDQVGDINFQIPGNSYIANQKPELIESTLLHWALRENKYHIFKYLLDRRIDFTIQNRNESTALLQPIEGILHEGGSSRTQELKRLVNKLDNPYTDLILSEHVSQNISKNPCNTYGISHFHVACLLDKPRAVEFFLKNGVSVNDAVSSNSPICPGFSPLHLSTASHSLETIKILLKYGAEKHPKDSSGTTPLHILIEMRFNSLKMKYKSKDEEQKELRMIVDKVRLLLKGRRKLIIDEAGLHVACIFPMPKQFVRGIQNINHTMNLSPPLLSGFTALHLAMIFESELAVPLLSGGADILARAMNGQTPLDILLARSSIDRIHFVLANVAGWNDIFLSDGKTRLVEVISVMRDVRVFDSVIRQNLLDVNSYVPVDSPLFQGLSILQLAVFFARSQQTNFDIIKICLNAGADPFAKNSYGSTALHLAFRLYRTQVVDLFLQHAYNTRTGRIFEHQNGLAMNAVDNDDLSVLHIAVAANNEDLVRQLLTPIGMYDVNSRVPLTFEWFNTEKEYRAFSIAAGSTSLHIAVATGNIEMLKLLLEKGGNIYAEDAYGLTPIHRALVDGNDQAANLLLSVENLQDRLVPGINLSHLHVASFANHAEAVDTLLKSGSDIEAVITCTSRSFSFLSDLDGCTPIHITMRQENADMTRYLSDRGADVLARKPDGTMPVYEHLIKYSGYFSLVLFTLLWDKIELRGRIERDTGLTLLHLACNWVHLELIHHSLGLGVNVNSRIHSNSPIWPGCTPLHLLMRRSIEISRHAELNEDSPHYHAIEILLANCADVSLLDAGGDSPLHIADERLADSDGLMLLEDRCSFMISITAKMLLSIKDFTVNPRNNRGITHFHVACRICHVGTMKKYLKSGCDIVNQRIDYYPCDAFAGYTPLLLSTNYCLDDLTKVRALEVLLDHGADCRVKDIFDNTPLHTTARSSHPLRGNMLEKLVDKGLDLKLQNVFGETAAEIVFKSSNITTGDIQLFLDYQDESGRTALHLAFRNREAVRGLLNSGADINIVDARKNSAAFYISNLWVIERWPINDIINLSFHVYKLRHLHLDVIQQNIQFQERTYTETRYYECIYEQRSLRFSKEMHEVESLNVGRTTPIPLRNFLSETGIVAAYPTMPLCQREEIKTFFETEMAKCQFQEIDSLLRLQYRKAVKRRGMMDSAKCAMHLLAKKSVEFMEENTFPDLCSEPILRYLTNKDIDNLIAATKCLKEDADLTNTDFLSKQKILQ